MSNAELNKKNGPVITYDGRVRTFNDFIQMGMSEKVEFLDRMQYLYEVSQYTLSQIWGIQCSKLNGYLNSIGIKMRPAYPNKSQKEAISQMIENCKADDSVIKFDIRAIGYTEFQDMEVQDRTIYVQQICNAFEITVSAVYMAIFNAKSLKSATNITRVFPVEKEAISTVPVNIPDNVAKYITWYNENAPEIRPPYTRYESFKRSNKAKEYQKISASKNEKHSKAAVDTKIAGEITLEGNSISDIIERLQKLQSITDTAEISMRIKI